MITAVRAGEDLLLGTADPELIARLDRRTGQAERRRLVDPASPVAAACAVGSVRQWLSGFDQPALDVVGCAEHAASRASSPSARSRWFATTTELLPLSVPQVTRIAVVQSPAGAADARRHDRSRDTVPGRGHSLASAATDDSSRPPSRPRGDRGTARARRRLRRRHRRHGRRAPAAGEAALAHAIAGAQLEGRVRCTAHALGHRGLPRSTTYACSYGILGPSMEALAAALFGETPFRALPVVISGMYHRGHGLTLSD